MFRGWEEVAKGLRGVATKQEFELNGGQRASLNAIAERLPNNGVIVADEVGMGKTRIAAIVARCVIDVGGRVAILVPPGLGYQWGDELRLAGVDSPLILRSLWQYLQAWEITGNQRPWFNEQAVVISHVFTNWRLGENSAPWRWALLPELYARWKKHAEERYPRNYHDNEMLDDSWVQQAAASIVAAVSDLPTGHLARTLIEDLIKNTPWPGALDASEYARDANLRPWLEKAVGLGLGMFDLVIIDEAHKSRGQDSGLSRLLEQVVLQTSNFRRLAMTATPVELDAEQWKQALCRIKSDGNSASEAISSYAEAVRRVRGAPSDAETRKSYKQAAKVFQKALSPYLLRRDKREDPAVKAFVDKSGEGFHAYRRENEILVDISQLLPVWKQAVCAAEALSFVTLQADDPVAKRLRLTLGNGHGIAALLDQIHCHDKDDQKQSEADGIPLRPGQGAGEVSASSDKRLQRAQWWQKLIIQPAQDNHSGDAALYDHPAILAAVAEIESVCQQEEKVLVFGRFTRPLRALVNLLNARAMLRSLADGKPWPQSKVQENEWEAIVSAHQQLELVFRLDRDELNQRLKQQYEQLEQQRRSFRERLVERIEEGFCNASPSKRVLMLFAAFKDEVANSGKHEGGHEKHSLAVVARAIRELIGYDQEAPSVVAMAQAFSDLVSAACDRDEGDTDGNGQLDGDEAGELWSNLVTRFREEYNRTEGGFARLMYGETKPETRRFLQLAFNRRHGYPKVLVAQSVVGREGLNLHKACRTVFLLHPEWNPGVVEQQIGRVDRLGSLWESKLDGPAKSLAPSRRHEQAAVRFFSTVAAKSNGNPPTSSNIVL